MTGPQMGVVVLVLLVAHVAVVILLRPAGRPWRDALGFGRDDDVWVDPAPDRPTTCRHGVEWATPHAAAGCPCERMAS
jgi:hypothetical protein